MIDLLDAPTLSLLADALFGFTAGALLGLIHFGSLWWNTKTFMNGSLMPAFAIQLGRFAILVTGLAALAKLGAFPLLGSALGLLLARSAVMRHVGRQS